MTWIGELLLSAAGVYILFMVWECIRIYRKNRRGGR